MQMWMEFVADHNVAYTTIWLRLLLCREKITQNGRETQLEGKVMKLKAKRVERAKERGIENAQ